MITLVCGLGRCGTSLTMKMLKRGGMPLFADKAGSHEHSRMTTLPKENYWVAYADNHALKVNDPHIYIPPTGLDYCAIWLTRDPNQQAKSMMKLNTALGKKEPGLRSSYRKKVRWIKRSEPKCYSLLNRLSKRKFIHYTFENIISNPLDYAEAIVNLVQLPMDIQVMADCVEQRDTASLEIPLEVTEQYRNNLVRHT